MEALAGAKLRDRVSRSRHKRREELGDDEYKARRAQYMRSWREKKKAGSKVKAEDPVTIPEPTDLEINDSNGKVNVDDEYDDDDDESQYDEVLEAGSNVNTTYMVLKHPFTCIVSGPSKSGKTELTKRILKWQDKMIQPNVEKVYWFYGAAGAISDMKDKFPDVEFVRGMPSVDWVRDQDRGVPKLVVLDDLMTSATNGFVSNMFTKSSHHDNISCMFLIQNIFPKEREVRQANLNTTYRIIFDSPHDRGQISTISTRMFSKGGADYLSSVLDAVGQDNPHPYIALDTDQTTPKALKVRTNIFPDDPVNHVYIPETSN